MRKKIFIFTVIFCFILFRIFDFYQDRYLTIYFLDVGQGDSILIRTPDYKHVLIDGGPDISVLSELGEVVPFWIRKIDYIILTHTDLDHIGGLVDVLNYYQVSKVFFNDTGKNTLVYKKFLNIIDQKNYPYSSIMEGNNLAVGCCVKLDILWPNEHINLKTIEPVNNSSVSARLIYRDFEIILAGDIESAIEEEMARSKNIKADLLKVNHHGSNTSSNEKFLDAVSPESAIISVGEKNKFGHPAPQTLDKLSKRNIEIYRTDISGRIKVRTNGTDYSVYCEKDCTGGSI
ncbi:MBL fold metallo-hydrolase [Candidatus Dojkabacteria bacterium]|nr:MBL fold metallo-hydrolase [Candidatus Dojkabacteria bacterium]